MSEVHTMEAVAPAPSPPAPVLAPKKWEEVAPLHWWLIAGGLFFSAIYFHTQVDPGVRFAFKHLGDPNFGPAWWDTQKFGPLTPADVATFAFAYLGLMKRFASGLGFSRKAITWSVVIALVCLVGSLVGILHQTPSPFGDWRWLFSGGLFAFGLWSTVLVTEEGCFRFAQIVTAIVTGYSVAQLLEYVRGGGEIAFYGRTPTGDHATLEFCVAAVGLSLALVRTGRTKFLWYAGILFPAAVVVLGFRRYAWVELTVVFLFFLLASGRARTRYLLGVLALGITAAIMVAATWNALAWGPRLASFSPSASKTTNVYATTNQSHVDDILDGLDEIYAHPYFGLGVGVTYVGKRTAQWKGDAGMVHNAPVEVWIKWGIIGVVVYFAAYFALFRDIWRRRYGTRYSDRIAWGGGAFLLGNFLVTSSVYGFEFSVWEKSLLVWTVIAMMYPSGRAATALAKRRRGVDAYPPVRGPDAGSPAIQPAQPEPVGGAA